MTPVTRSQDKPGEIDLTFVISEGTQYKVRNVIIEGNRRIKTEALRKDLELLSGKPFMLAVRDADKSRMLIQYGEIGCIDAQIKCEPRFTDQLGVVDLVYSIEEREPFSLGELEIVGNDRTKDKVIRREAVMAGLLPGEVLDKNRIEIFRRRLMGLGYFMNDPQQGKQIKIDIVRQRPSDQPYGDLMTPVLAGCDAGRGCKTLARASTWFPHRRQAPGGAPGTTVEPNVPGVSPFGVASRSSRRPTCRRSRCPSAPPMSPPVPVRALPNPASRRLRRAAGHGPEHPRHEHDRRQPRPQRPVPQPVVRRHRDVDRRGPDRSIHDRRRGQQLSGLDRQLADLREELRHHQFSSLASVTSSTGRRFEGAASRS